MSTTRENNDNQLRGLIKSHGIKKPEIGFADSVMEKIELSEQNKPELLTTPLITTGGWILIGLIIIIMFSLAFVLGSPSQFFATISGYTEIFKIQPIIINIPSTYLIGLFGFITFFLVEITLIQRKYNRV